MQGTVYTPESPPVRQVEGSGGVAVSQPPPEVDGQATVQGDVPMEAGDAGSAEEEDALSEEETGEDQMEAEEDHDL